MMKSQLFYIYNYTMVKVRSFCWWCCVCCIVLFALSFLVCLFLRSRHDHNKIAPCGMIKVFEFESEECLDLVFRTLAVILVSDSFDRCPLMAEIF